MPAMQSAQLVFPSKATYCEEILHKLRVANAMGNHWVGAWDLAQVAGLHFTARITELRKRGYDIQCEKYTRSDGRKLTRYRLVK